jgi:L-gulonolactone oxidase
MVNLDRYSNVIAMNKERRQVTVQAGIKLWQLNEYLDKEGMALINLGSIAEQSVAGAISTATHGSGIKYSILASQVQRISLIKADGSKVNIDKDADKELFETAIISLGALGVVSELTLNICNAFQLHDHTSLMPFDEMLGKLGSLTSNTDHFKMWWFPHTDKIVLYQYNRTDKPRNDSRLRQWLMDEVLSVVVYRFLVFLGNLNPRWRPFFNSLLILSFKKPLDRIEKSYKVFNVPAPPIHRETEWAFDIKDAAVVLAAYKKLIEGSDHKINFIQEIRFTKADNYALSPCYGRDTIWVGCYLIGNNGWPELLADFEALARSYNGRPHWGKEFNTSKDHIEQQYPQMAEFKKLKNNLDPSGKFSNKMIEQYF